MSSPFREVCSFTNTYTHMCKYRVMESHKLTKSCCPQPPKHKRREKMLWELPWSSTWSSSCLVAMHFPMPTKHEDDQVGDQGMSQSARWIMQLHNLSKHGVSYEFSSVCYRHSYASFFTHVHLNWWGEHDLDIIFREEDDLENFFVSVISCSCIWIVTRQPCVGGCMSLWI